MAIAGASFNHAAVALGASTTRQAMSIQALSGISDGASADRPSRDLSSLEAAGSTKCEVGFADQTKPC